tara:strand:- start:111 stop:596 length:486 start_codon:yes stop_codon:yes gene_type:complete
MPSFDIVSKPNIPSVNNAIDGVQREINTRYDFKGSKSKVEISENVITITADDELKRKQVEELLNTHVTRQKVDSKFLRYEKIEIGSGNTIRQIVEVKTGVAREDAQKIIKLVKSMKSKVQIQIQGDELRVSGKKRDELQSVIAFIKNKFDYIPLQYINFRD